MKYLIPYLLLSALGEAAQVAVPPVFKPTQAFHLLKEETAEEPKTLVEHLSFGEKTPALLSWDGNKKVFLMGAPEVDRCGLIHFHGKAVELKHAESYPETDVRFYELSEAIDITCHPIPFPRCGTFRSTEHQTAGDYLWDQLALLKAECRAFFLNGNEVGETYQIRLPLPSPG